MNPADVVGSGGSLTTGAGYDTALRTPQKVKISLFFSYRTLSHSLTDVEY